MPQGQDRQLGEVGGTPAAVEETSQHIAEHVGREPVGLDRARIKRDDEILRIDGVGHAVRGDMIEQHADQRL